MTDLPAENARRLVETFRDGCLPMVLFDRISADVTRLDAWCESPIEIMLGAAMLSTWRVAGSSLPLTLWHNPNLRNAPPGHILMLPQYEWTDWRVDFALIAPPTGLEFNPLFIECDGHNFHERTKEQASRDRARDRLAQVTGHTVLRYTGSEIYNNAWSCAFEIYQYVEGSLSKCEVWTAEAAE